MRSLMRVPLSGFLLSATGALPLGVLNFTAVQIALQSGWAPALSFAAGVVLVELCCVFILLRGTRSLIRLPFMLKVMERVSVLLLVCFALSSVYSAVSGEPTMLLPIYQGGFWLGVVLSALNPFQWVYWLGWNLTLMNRGVLRDAVYIHMQYLFGIGLGTFVVFCLFIQGGQLLLEYLNKYQSWLDWAFALLFAGMAFAQLLKIKQGKRLTLQ